MAIFGTLMPNHLGVFLVPHVQNTVEAVLAILAILAPMEIPLDGPEPGFRRVQSYLGVIFDPFLGHFGPFLGPGWDPFWAHFGPIFGPFLDPFLDPFLGHFQARTVIFWVQKWTHF